MYFTESIRYFIPKFYEKIFNEKMSNEVIHFLRNLSYVAVGTIIGNVFTFIYNILAGRVLGPTEYGKYSLIYSIAMFLYIPMLLGFSTAMVKYTSEKVDAHGQKDVISTTYMLAFLFTLSSIIIYSLFSSNISSYLNISIKELYYSIIFAILYAFNLLTISTLQSIKKIKLLSILNSFQGIILFGSFLFFISNKMMSYKSMIFSMYIGYGLAGVIILVFIRKYLDLRSFNGEYSKILFKYSIFTLFGGISHMLYTNIDKILINRYMPIENVGLYNAYYFSSINIITVFSGIFMTVYFPTVSGYNDKSRILKKVNKMIPFLFILGFPCMMVSQMFVLKLYGNEYSLNILLMTLFAITSILTVCYGLYGWTYNSIGIKGAKIAFKGTGTIAIVNVLLNLCLIPTQGLSGAILATALAHLTGIWILYTNRDELRPVEILLKSA